MELSWPVETTEAAALEAFLFWMLVFTMFLKLTVIGFVFRVLIDSLGFEDSLMICSPWTVE